MTPLYKPMLPRAASDIIGEVLKTGAIASGRYVAEFEAALSAFLGADHVICASDISGALTMALFCCGVRPGDDVIMAPMVCLSTTCPVANLFATIRWCDVDPQTGGICPVSLRRAITAKTKAIVLYHWAGYPADIDGVQAVAREFDVPVIEDAGEAFGATYGGKHIGATGSDFTVFSFYPNRQLTTIEGGAVACKDLRNAETLRRLRRYGIHQGSFRLSDGEINPRSDIPIAGWNYYMNNVSAALGVAQMASINTAIERWRENGRYFDDAMIGLPGVSLLRRDKTSIPAYWVYTFLADDQRSVVCALREAGVAASRVHLRNDRYTAFGGSSDVLPGVNEFAAKCVSIPCGPWVTDEERDNIVKIIKATVRKI